MQLSPESVTLKEEIYTQPSCEYTSNLMLLYFFQFQELLEKPGLLTVAGRDVACMMVRLEG